MGEEEGIREERKTENRGREEDIRGFNKERCFCFVLNPDSLELKDPAVVLCKEGEKKSRKGREKKPRKRGARTKKEFMFVEKESKPSKEEETAIKIVDSLKGELRNMSKISSIRSRGR